MSFYDDAQDLIKRGRELFNDLERTISEHASTLPAEGPVNPPAPPVMPQPAAAPPAPEPTSPAPVETTTEVLGTDVNSVSDLPTPVPNESITGDTTNA